MMTTPDAALHMRIAPQPQQSRIVREKAEAFAEAHRIGQVPLSHFLSALGEAVANAIEHSGTREPIDVDIRVGSDRLVAVVRDRGVGFDATAFGEVVLPDGRAERGRGLPIMRCCTDFFSVESIPGFGTTVVVGVHVPATSDGNDANEAGAA